MVTAKKLRTLEEWLDLDDDLRAELIDGEMVRKAAPSAEHSFCQQGISASLNSFIRRSGGGPGGWWIGTEAAVVYPGRPNGFIHDLAGWRRDRHSDRPHGKRITAKPDWVCEILSGNRGNDLVTKKWVLHEHRVEYVWMMDLGNEILSVLKWAERGYLTIADHGPVQTCVRIEPFEAIELTPAALFGRDEE